MKSRLQTPVLPAVLLAVLGMGCSETNELSEIPRYGGDVGHAELSGGDADFVPDPGDVSAQDTTAVDGTTADPGGIETRTPATDSVDAADSPPAPDIYVCPLTVKRELEIIGPAENCGSMTGISKPSLALDSTLNPHVVVDKDLPLVYIYHRLNGQWSEGLFANAADYGTARIHLPHIEIDSGDRAWVSGWFGAKGMPGGKMGQGLWLVNGVQAAPSPQFLVLANEGFKNGNVAIDPAEPDKGVVMTKEGKWEKYGASGQKAGSGKMNIGTSGEKIRFTIRPREGQIGVWHAVMSGWSQHSSAYQNSVRHNAGEGLVIWASKEVYTEMGEDMLHPGLGTDGADPLAAYIAIRYHTGVVINIWDGSTLVFPPENLPVVATDSASHGNGGERFGPQWTPVQGGGAYLCWTGSDKKIRLKYFDKAGNSGEPAIVTSGKQCAMTTDHQGNIHMVYVEGTLKYRKITTGPECWDHPK